MQSIDINILTIRFRNGLKPFEVQPFRGAIINSLKEKRLLFHNHDGKNLRYGYPLIQYKSLGGQASVVCVGEGTEEVWHFFEDSNFNLHIGHRTEHMDVENMRHDKFSISIAEDNMYVYHITHWLPLNEENYKAYIRSDNLCNRITLLERLLTGNILSMLKGVGLHAESKITTSIVDISHPNTAIYKKVRLVMFEATFRTNVLMPDYIGLGRHTSVGYGIINQVNNNKEKNI
ncbi:MAG TPA: hypothetical protein DEQ17_02830 [Prevotella sp.]|nr:hypothetical protein [Prevotella sp.]